MASNGTGTVGTPGLFLLLTAGRDPRAPGRDPQAPPSPRGRAGAAQPGAVWEHRGVDPEGVPVAAGFISVLAVLFLISGLLNGHFLVNCRT